MENRRDLGKQRLGLSLLFASVLLSLSLIWNLSILQTEAAWITQIAFLSVSAIWAGYLVHLLWKRNWRGIKLWFLPALVVAISVSLCKIITHPQIEEARFRGAEIMARVMVYTQDKGKYPSSLTELSEFDGVAIPKTGLGIWGNTEYEFFAETFNGQIFWIGFNEYGYEQHTLHPGQDWITLSESMAIVLEELKNEKR